MIANTWTYISLYVRNTAILQNNKSVYIFPHQRVNTGDLHLVNFPNLPIGDIFTGFVQTFFLKFIKFQSHLKKNLAVVMYSGWD